MTFLQRIYRSSSQLAFLLGLIVFAFCIWFVVNTLFIHPTGYVDFSIFNSYDIYAITGLISLMLLFAFANIGVEALKWKKMTSKIQEISFMNSLKSITQGFAVGFITPNRIGDYPGRAILFSNENRPKIIFTNLLSGYAQFIVICFLTLITLFFLPIDFNLFFSNYSTFKILYLLFFILLILFHVIFLFKTNYMINLFARIKIISRLTKYIDDFKDYSTIESLYFIHLSLLRTIIYSVQLFILLNFFERNVYWFDLLCYINIYFFVLTIAPSFLLNKFGIRESVSLLVFSPVIDNPAIIVISTLLLWFLNQVIPAIFGSITLLTFRK